MKKTDKSSKNSSKKSSGSSAGKVLAVILFIVVIVAAACIEINRLNEKDDYDSYLSDGQKASDSGDYSTAFEKYGKAIEAQPGDGTAYLELVSDVILADGGFDYYENKQMKQIFTSSGLAQLKTKDIESYNKLMYTLGNAYYFMYSNEVIGRKVAKEYFEEVKDASTLSEKERGRASALYRICEYTEALRAFNSKDEEIEIDFKEFWEDLTDLLNIEYDLSADRLLAAKSYEVFYQYAQRYKLEFLKAGIKNDEMLGRLKYVQEQILEIQRLEKESGRLPAHTDINADVENLEYNIEQIKKAMNSEEISENVDMDTLFFGYELDSYVRSLLDYDDEHSIKNVVSDIELLILDRYKVTECQVIVFNGLDEQKLLVEDRDYSFELVDDDAYIDSEGSNGYKYAVNIHSNIFNEEGTYTIVVAAKDALADRKYEENAVLISNIDVPAKNITLKADEIKFTLDNSAPEITVSGIANNARYDSDRDITIDYADTSNLSSIILEVTDGTNVIDKVEYDLSKFEDNEKKTGSISYTMKENQKYQTLRITAKDIAGNESVYEQKVLITSSYINKTMNDRPMIIGVAIAGVIVVLVVIIGISRLMKK